jgi:hypothetical protein
MMVSVIGQSSPNSSPYWLSDEGMVKPDQCRANAQERQRMIQTQLRASKGILLDAYAKPTRSVPGCHRLAALDTRKCEEPLRKTARNYRIAFLKTKKGTLELPSHFHIKGT